MPISELIRRLSEIAEGYGDLEVFMPGEFGLLTDELYPQVKEAKLEKDQSLCFIEPGQIYVTING